MSYGSSVPGTHDVYRTSACYIQKPKRKGVWVLFDMELPDRSNVAQNTNNKSATATWLREWNLGGPRANPPHTGGIPMTLEYLYRHELDIAYIASLANDETLRTFKLRIQNTPHTMAAVTKEYLEIRIKQLHSDAQWMQVWKNYIRPRYRRKSHPCGT